MTNHEGIGLAREAESARGGSGARSARPTCCDGVAASVRGVAISHRSTSAAFCRCKGVRRGGLGRSRLQSSTVCAGTWMMVRFCSAMSPHGGTSTMTGSTTAARVGSPRRPRRSLLWHAKWGFLPVLSGWMLADRPPKPQIRAPPSAQGPVALTNLTRRRRSQDEGTGQSIESGAVSDPPPACA